MPLYDKNRLHGTLGGKKGYCLASVVSDTLKLTTYGSSKRKNSLSLGVFCGIIGTQMKSAPNCHRMVCVPRTSRIGSDLAFCASTSTRRHISCRESDKKTKKEKSFTFNNSDAKS